MSARFLMFFVILLSLPFNSESQVLEPVRTEIPARIDAPGYYKLLLGERGMLHYYESTDFNEDGKRKWFFSLYDTGFREQWTQSLGLMDGYGLAGSVVTSKYAFMLFSTNTSRKSNQRGYELLRFDAGSGTFQLMGSLLPEKAEIQGFTALLNLAFIGVNLPDYQSDLLMINMDQLITTSLSHGISGQNIIQAVQADEKSGKFIVGFKRFTNNRFEEEVFQIYNNEGIQRQTFSYKLDPNYLHSYLLNFDTVGNLIVAGSYDNNAGGRNAAKDAANQDALTFESKGLFFLRFTEQGIETQRFYPFESFGNIYRALPTDELMRARQRQARSKEGARQPADISFQFFKPRLIQHHDFMVFAAEAFKPQYRLETRMDYDFYGRMVPYTYSIFEGYNYFSALIVAFDQQGNLIWSNDVELRDILLPYLQNVVTVQLDGIDVVASYVTEGVITSKVVGPDGKEKGQTEQVKIESTFANDRLLEENFTDVTYWYDKYFLVSGYQKISNNKLRTDNPRTVYFLQKLVFE